MNTELVKKIRQCPNLPSLPSIAVQILELASKPNVDIAEIARLISKDPALSTKILRTVNSSFYGRSQHVSTISHALVILGLQSVKTLVLGFSLVTTLSKDKQRGFNHLNYWRRSIYAATAARTIAIKMNIVQQEEAFLGALLQDIGMLVLDQAVGQQYSEICAKSSTHLELVKAETEALGMTHAEIGAILAEQWKLPPILVTTIGASHDPSTVTDRTLKAISLLVHLAGLCADVFVDAQAANAIVQVRALCASAFKLSEADCDKLLDEISVKTKEVVSLFEIKIGVASNFEAILEKANEALVELTLQSQMQASKLQQQNQVLQKRATIDALTGLNNRAVFDESLKQHFAASRTAASPLTLLMIDVDNFKAINDHWGHQIGDLVLAGLGKLLRSAARHQDLAARYGGEEMALLLPQTPRAVAAALAETIRLAIAKKPMVCGTQSVPVTVSIGVATLEPHSLMTDPSHLLKAADMAVYAAKHSGRNCVKIFSLKDAA
ncbi:MAG TPA: GGDEF domain-containing protein [Tepidisphaeraceae bacterium]|nr:GGDEF domain-containing protein [Tepidisphaeraceae bacterium]